MALIDLSFLTGNGNDAYDDVTGIVTLTTQPGLTTDEGALLSVLETLETLAQNKRTNLNFPISEKAFPDEPAYSYVSRSDEAATPTNETQIEREYQLVGWYKAQPISAANAINNND